MESAAFPARSLYDIAPRDGQDAADRGGRALAEPHPEEAPHLADFGIDVDPGEVGLDARRLGRIDTHFRQYVDDGRLAGSG